MSENRNIIISNAVDVDADGFSRMHADNVLAPGYYWRAKVDIVQMDKTWNRERTILDKDEVVLLLDVFEFEGNAHSVEILESPGKGGRQTHQFMVEEFFEKMEPCHDAEAVCAREQAAIMQQVQDIQEEMSQAEINPLALPGVKDAAEKAISEFERTEEIEASRTEKSDAERQKDLRRIHRRATRRSESAGNPLVEQKTIVSNQLSDMINGGVTSEGLQELTLEARRRTAIATATAKWLTDRAQLIGRTMEKLTPFYAERAKVALARSKKAISYAEEISKGLKSLELYTGDGVDVVTIRQGATASTSIPLTLVQGKRFMAEEIAVFADIDDNFDCSDQAIFFERLAKNDALRDQLFPTKRCVLSMATNRHRVQYDDKMGPFERAMRDAANRAVFLLVRDGDNIHVVYSTEPSHEAASRLFPSNEDIHAPFEGIDGTKINLKEVAFSSASKKFDDQALHYKRFLILLCGLDHRLKLLGEFYPSENSLQFMSMDFQSKYFHFLEDDAPGTLIGNNMEPVGEWMERCNTSVRSGSRVMLTAAAVSNSPGLNRLSDSFKIVARDLQRPVVVSREGKHHFVTISAQAGHDNRVDAKIWLDGPDVKVKNVFLCLDLVRQPVVFKYIHSRVNRASSVGWLRIFKRVEHLLSNELIEQAELRNHLRGVAVEHGGLDAAAVEEAMELAILSWRAGHRGADAPALSNTKAVNEILTLMYPSSKIAQTIDAMLTKLITEQSLTPLRLSRTGKTRLALYVAATDEDRVPYAQGCQWGWVKRLVIDPLKTKLSIASSSLVWLEKGKVDPTEEEIRAWPQMDSWLNEHPEPVLLRKLGGFTEKMNEAVVVFGDLLKTFRSSPANAPLDADLFAQIKTRYEAYYRQATTYSNTARISLPVGVRQDKPGAEVKFLYMECTVIDFVSHYGDESQLRMLIDTARRYGFRSRETSDTNKTVSWHFAQTKEVFSHWVNGGAFTAPGFSKLKLKKNLATSKKSFFPRSDKKKGDGKPQLNECEITLSWNRAVDALMGKAPHVKRNFYKNVKKEIRSAKSFPDFDGTRKDKIKGLQSKVYEPSTAPRAVSPLIWDQDKGRSMAGLYFPAKREVGR